MTSSQSLLFVSTLESDPQRKTFVMKIENDNIT